jgi:hypothetical protein
MLVHLKGNIKTISIEASGKADLLTNSSKLGYFTYRFKNNKLISDNSNQYFYDKNGYLTEINNGLFSTFFIADSTTHQLLKIKYGTNFFDVNETTNEVTIGKVMSCSLNKEKKVVAYSLGLEIYNYAYDENGDLSSYYSYYIGGECNYTTFFDKYYNLVYYSCNAEKAFLPYLYSNLDEKGNWQLGQSMSQSEIMKTPFVTKRTYEYYPD